MEEFNCDSRLVGNVTSVCGMYRPHRRLPIHREESGQGAKAVVGTSQRGGGISIKPARSCGEQAKNRPTPGAAPVLLLTQRCKKRFDQSSPGLNTRVQQFLYRLAVGKTATYRTQTVVLKIAVCNTAALLREALGAGGTHEVTEQNIEEVNRVKMAAAVKLLEPPLNQPQPDFEQPSQEGAGESKQPELKYELFSVANEDHQFLQEKAVNRLEEETENHEEEGPGHTEVHKVTSGQREGIFQNGDLASQKGEMSQNDNLETPPENKQAEVSRKRCCNVRDLRDVAVSEGTSSGQSPYQCSVCSKSFRRSFNLLQHQRVHTTTKPYKCVECGKSFSHNSALSKHHNVHRGECTFQCRDCGDRFTRSSSLIVHQKTHLGEKPHLCKECRKCFRNVLELMSHQQLHS
ncbi:PREDICTED: zinc finger protein 572-like [Tinamus guttatus]|uniref:zinc finger protein 572-like n=1 Tax=Tinamus guttatus TaxID=94827 RepID=UPI00052EAF6D|nr:PREDICTED: zinc finger protein 572-like [Tinamus guttatus]